MMDGRHNWARWFVGAALIGALAVATYWPSLTGGFIFDDEGLLTKNTLIHAPDGLRRFWFTTEPIDYWPVTNSSLWVEWRLWGDNPTGYRVTNLVLHIVDALLLWIVLRVLRIPGAFLAAAIFTVHPVNVETVAWISQRKNLLAMLFFLLALLACLHRHSGRFRGSMYALSLVAFVLAMLSKGSVAFLPLVLLLIVWWKRDLRRWDLVRIAPFFVVAAALAGVNVWFQHHGTDEVIRVASFSQRLAGAGAVVWFYFFKAIVPVNLAFVYPQWEIQPQRLVWWVPLAAAAGVTSILWRHRNRWGRPMFFAWAGFCVSLLPVMGFTDVGFMKFSLVADHYQHIAIIAVIALFAGAMAAWRGAAGYGLWAGVVGLLAVLTYQQSALYRDAVTLYQDTLEKNPDAWVVRNNLGLLLVKAGRPLEAIEHYEHALRLQPDDGEFHDNLATALLQTGRVPQAVQHYSRATQLKPRRPESHNNLANALLAGGQLAEAIQHYQRAVELNDNFADAHNNLGTALSEAGQWPTAVAQYQRAIELQPDAAQFHYNLSSALEQTGDAPAAIRHLREAVRLKADYVEARNNLGTALARSGRLPEAIEQFHNLLRLRPDYVAAWMNLAMAQAESGNPAQAAAAARRAVELSYARGDTTQASQLRQWLDSYHAVHQPATAPSSP